MSTELDSGSESTTDKVISSIRDFLRLESSSGILLVAAAILAMIIENSPMESLYDTLLGTPVAIRIGEFEIAKPLLLWINDGLMAVFFFLIGLEVKREALRGELSDPSKVALPVIGAIGGMAAPAAIYSWVNWGDSIAMEGWAIPSATDIAFALGVLSLLGNRVPNSLKVFLLTLAIIDDLGAIIIIAIFYTADLSVLSLSVASVCIAVLFILNRKGVLSIAPYLIVGLILWASVLKSGVHATLAGVILGLFIPLQKSSEYNTSPLEKLEHDLHPTVAFFILPVFAFANTGVSLQGVSLDSILAPVPLGIAAGLFFGNQIGVFGLSWIAVKLGIAKLPEDVKWIQLYGVAMLCGIGFTMSLFISSLAFEQTADQYIIDDRLGILVGSLLSASLGYFLLRMVLPENAADAEQTKKH
ncbi:MAG: sodium:proton antiporter [Gammaproteobacteria bacterium SG8_15]|nr:MAG: sodium:proton antiporter [Gammaproteobacteria bacterium SG8_15]